MNGTANPTKAEINPADVEALRVAAEMGRAYHAALKGLAPVLDRLEAGGWGEAGVELLRSTIHDALEPHGSPGTPRHVTEDIEGVLYANGNPAGHEYWFHCLQSGLSVERAASAMLSDAGCSWEETAAMVEYAQSVAV